MKGEPLTLAGARAELRRLANPTKAAFFPRFFKCGPGEYGEGDKFIGVTVPQLREVAKRAAGLGPKDLKTLLLSPLHEERVLALLILVGQYRKADNGGREKIFRFYLANLGRVNNWDLVDCSAEHIVGAHLHAKDTSLLYRLVRSKTLWDRRVAIVSTFHFIRRGVFDDTLALAERLLADEEDLMHKATGWMLREVGKRDERTLERFLRTHVTAMPRTMLRYAIERFPERKRLAYLRR